MPEYFRAFLLLKDIISKDNCKIFRQKLFFNFFHRDGYQGEFRFYLSIDLIFEILPTSLPTVAGSLERKVSQIFIGVDSS